MRKLWQMSKVKTGGIVGIRAGIMSMKSCTQKWVGEGSFLNPYVGAKRSFFCFRMAWSVLFHWFISVIFSIFVKRPAYGVSFIAGFHCLQKHHSCPKRGCFCFFFWNMIIFSFRRIRSCSSSTIFRRTFNGIDGWSSEIFRRFKDWTL